MLDWTEEKPTERGWYIWHRAEYDTMRTEFYKVDWSTGDDTRLPDNLRAFPGNKHLAYIVGGLWYGPIPFPPVSPLDC
jgi:hypothetical protein